MTIQKPSKGRLRVEIDPSIHKRILNNLPEHKRSQPLTHIVNDLIHEALDTHITLGKPSPLGASERAKVLHSYINKNKESNKEVKKKLAKAKKLRTRQIEMGEVSDRLSENLPKASLRKSGGKIKKMQSGGRVGAPRGTGAALRGFGKGYK